AGLIVLQYGLTLLARVAVVHIDGQPLEIEADTVTEQQHQSHRHDHDNEQAARITENLDEFFPGYGQEANEAHAFPSFSESRAVVTETKTSSRLGCIFSIRPTEMLCSDRYVRTCGIAVAASCTTRCNALPKTAASITSGADCRTSTAFASGSHSTSSSSPIIDFC